MFTSGTKNPAATTCDEQEEKSQEQQNSCGKIFQMNSETKKKLDIWNGGCICKAPRKWFPKKRKIYFFCHFFQQFRIIPGLLKHVLLLVWIVSCSSEAFLNDFIILLPFSGRSSLKISTQNSSANVINFTLFKSLPKRQPLKIETRLWLQSLDPI